VPRSIKEGEGLGWAEEIEHLEPIQSIHKNATSNQQSKTTTMTSSSKTTLKSREHQNRKTST